MSNPYDHSCAKEGARGPFFAGDKASGVTAQVVGTRKMISEKLEELRQRTPDGNVELITPPTIPCFRMTRRLVGQYSMTESDIFKVAS